MLQIKPNEHFEMQLMRSNRYSYLLFLNFILFLQNHRNETQNEERVKLQLKYM
jgi:hypothetical protein